MKLNLSGAKRIVEDLMEDECLVLRDVERTVDDTWNSTTGEYTPPVTDEVTIYEGQCGISGQTGSPIEYGGQYEMNAQYWLSIPLESDPILPLDRVVITVSLRDKELIDKEFIVDDQIFGSFVVSKRIRMHLLTVVPHG